MEEMTESEIVEAFENHDADEINTMVGVSGWVPVGQVNSLLDTVSDAYVQYGHEKEKIVATE